MEDSCDSTPTVDATVVDDSTPTVVCSRCGTRCPMGIRCINPKCRCLLKGTQLARTHGLYAQKPLPADIVESVEALRAGVVSDRGGASELSTLEHSYVAKLGDIEIAIRLLTEDIATHGLLTPSGRVRDSYEKLLAGLAAFDRYAQRIGLERRARRLDLAQAFAEQERERERERA